MINVRFFENKLKDRFEITVEGHAKAAEKGEDLICASASILSLTLAQVIKYMEQQGFLVNKAKIKIKDGYTFVSCKPKSDCYDTVKNSILTIKTGFKILSDGLPEFVNISDVGNA